MKRLEAKEVISSLEGRGPVLVMFSGGKDSLATLMLAVETLGARNVEAVYMDSSITLPGILRFVEAVCHDLAVKLHVTHPVRDYQGDFAYQVRRWGCFPTVNKNWCRIRLKLRPCRTYLRKVYGCRRLFKLQGVRRDESSRRWRLHKDAEFIWPDDEHSGSFSVFPILNWTGEDVAQYIKDKELPVNPAYAKYGVSDCKWCPFYQPEIYQRIHSLHPGIYDDILALEEEINKPCVTGRLWLRDVLSHR